MVTKLFPIVLVAMLCLCTSQVHADAIPPLPGSQTAPGTGIWETSDSEGRKATAVFTAVGNDLLITLTNIATDAATSPIFVLQGLFFDVVGNSPTLLPDSAIVPAGNSLVNSDGSLSLINSDGLDVGGNWAYRGDMGADDLPEGQKYGIAAVGLDVFGPPYLFDTSNSKGSGQPNGPDYGLVPLSGIQSSFPGGGGVYPLVSNTTQFLLTGWDNRSLNLINNVSFQYGTSLASTNGDNGNGSNQRRGSSSPVPEPGAALLALGAMGALVMRRRRKTQ